MDLDKVFGTDKNLEEEGVWVQLDDTSAIKVARIGNTNFKKAAIALKKTHGIVSKHTNDIPDEAMIELIANHVLLGWEGIKAKGKEIPFSVENATKMLEDYNDFLELVVEVANERETFRKQEIEKGKKELKKS